VRVLVGSSYMPQGKLALRLIWEPRDLWVGVFWNHSADRGARWTLIYVCLVPALPICLAIRRK
jgi:hypothetical protein